MPQTRILFVDDDVLNQWVLTDSLSALGFEVIGLCRGAAAIELLKDGEDFDLLLTDLHMPDGVSGFELANHWRQVHPGRPIIYTSDRPQMALWPLERDEGFIRKHADARDVISVIIELLTVKYSDVIPAAAQRAHYIN
jgi:CheY-like chemotaxis protein